MSVQIATSTLSLFVCSCDQLPESCVMQVFYKTRRTNRAAMVTEGEHIKNNPLRSDNTVSLFDPSFNPINK